MSESRSNVLYMRIDEKIKNRLEKESLDKEISFNGLLRQILTRHVKWYNMAEKMDMITMPKKAYRTYTKNITTKDIKKIALTVGKENFKSYTLLNSGKLNIKSFIETLKTWFDINNIAFQYVVKDNDDIEFVILHDLGKKFSVLFSTIVSSVAKELDKKFTVNYMTDDKLTFIISTGN